MDSMLLFFRTKISSLYSKKKYQLINKTEVLGNKKSYSKAFTNEVSNSFLFERFSRKTVKRLISK